MTDATRLECVGIQEPVIRVGDLEPRMEYHVEVLASDGMILEIKYKLVRNEDGKEYIQVGTEHAHTLLSPDLNMEMPSFIYLDTSYILYAQVNNGRLHMYIQASST